MPHTETRDYFVSIVRGNRRGLLAGPFTSHTAALVYVPFARNAASEVDPWTDFDAIGTCSLPAGSGRKGALNERLKIPPEHLAKQLLTVCKRALLSPYRSEATGVADMKFDRYTVQTFTTRGSTCPMQRHRILTNGKCSGTTEFSNFADAERFAALLELRSFAKSIGVALDMTDSELLARLRRVMSRAEAERARNDQPR